MSRRGRCKWFNSVKGWGFITPFDGSPDVFVHQSVIQLPGFRSLAQKEEVEFDSEFTDKGWEATRVVAVKGEPSIAVVNLQTKPLNRRRRVRKIRCYNCGEYDNHIAKECPFELKPKHCHLCRESDHLMADCPSKKVKMAKKFTGKNQSGSSAL